MYGKCNHFITPLQYSGCLKIPESTDPKTPIRGFPVLHDIHNEMDCQIDSQNIVNDKINFTQSYKEILIAH